MSRPTRVSASALCFLCVSLLTAQAETLRCQSVNGNVNCAGSGAVSCQTVNGRTICVSRNGDVVQAFGSHGAPDTDPGEPEDDAPAPDLHQQVEIRGPGGHRMSVRRDGSALHFRSDSMMIDRD